MAPALLNPTTEGKGGGRDGARGNGGGVRDKKAGVSLYPQTMVNCKKQVQVQVQVQSVNKSK